MDPLIIFFIERKATPRSLDVGWHVGYVTKLIRASRFGPFPTEEQAQRVCDRENEKRDGEPCEQG